MRICFVVLSPTFGMHQYSADLANGCVTGNADSIQVDVMTVRSTPRDRFAPQVRVHPIANIYSTGLKLSNFNLIGLRKFYRAIIQSKPDVIHFTSPHLWNPILLAMLKRAGIPTIHTIHDLDPHSGSGYGSLLYLWNDSIKRTADHLVVHGQVYRTRLLAQGLPADRVTYLPLLHLFLNHTSEMALGRRIDDSIASSEQSPFVLFFARLEAYKGVAVLIEAMRQIEGRSNVRAVIAGTGEIAQFVSGPLPRNVEVRNRLIEDQEAIELFRQCSLVVLPYIDATQSALIAAAYFFGKAVIVTRTGALPEYVIDGETGWIIEPQNAYALADRLLDAVGDRSRLIGMGAAGRAWYDTQRSAERRTLRFMYEQVSHREPGLNRETRHLQEGQYVDHG